MSLLDIFTGGKSDSASDAMKRAEDYFGTIQTPTLQQLTLPELQKYVEAGIMTPAEAQSYLQESNAFNNQNIDQSGTRAQIQALNQLAQIANAGAEGTPLAQAQIENALQQARTADQGAAGAIEQAMAAKGTPTALIQAVLRSQTQGQNAQQAHMDAVNAQAANYQAALNALAAGGSLGGQLQGQQNTQANTVAAAQNAMQQFNAQNQQQNSQFNAANRQAANEYNTQNRQNVSNQNTALGNTRTMYNAQLPQQIFNNQLSKASGMAGAATNAANLAQQQGQQNAGIIGGLINAGTSFIPKPGAGAQPFQAKNPTEDAFNTQYKTGGYAHGGIVNPMYCADGMMIPGEANFPGDDTKNDTVPIMASPGEAVISREKVAENPEIVDSLLNEPTQIIDTQDIVSIMKALRAIRMGE